MPRLGFSKFFDQRYGERDPCGVHMVEKPRWGISPGATTELPTLLAALLLAYTKPFEDVVEHLFGRYLTRDLRERRGGFPDVECQILF